MKSGTGRFFYELVYWAIVGTIVYFYRDTYKSVETSLEPILQAYTGVGMMLICLALIFAVFYLKEAIASTVIGVTTRMMGGTSVNYETGNAPRNIQKAARALERKGNFDAAGETYESLELWQDAALVYERGNILGRAAQAWKMANNPGKAIELYEKDLNYEAAAKICLQEGLQDRAAKNFRLAAEACMEGNQFVAAAELFEQAHDYLQAGHMFKNAHKTDRALACYEKARDIPRIVEILDTMHPSDYMRRGADFTRLVQRCAEIMAQSGQPVEAAQILEECQDTIRAAELYANSSMWEKSAELYLKAGREDLATQMARNIEDKRIAADISARLSAGSGNWDKAGEYFEEAGKQNQAIDAYKKARNFEAAARIYENMGRYIMAGEMYSSAKNLASAANAYAKAYDWRNAAECFEEAGDLAQAIEAYSNANNYLKAGMLSIRLTDYARAIEYLQRIPSGSPDFLHGTAFLATAFYYQNQFDMAYELFERVMEDLPLNRETLPVYYAYARNLESDDPKKSLSVFRQILGVDVHYSDVNERCRTLEQIVTSMTTGYSNRASIPHAKATNIGQAMPAPAPPYQVRPPAFPGENTDSSIAPRLSDSQTNPITSDSNETLIDGRYQVQEMVTQAAQIIDYSGTDVVSNQRVFIRLFPMPDAPAMEQRTMDALERASRLSHPNLVPIVRFGKQHNQAFVVSEFVSNNNLKQWVRQSGPLAMNSLHDFFEELLQAIGYAHSQNVFHSNLRPEMIFIGNPPKNKIHITGFGLPIRNMETNESLYQTSPDFDPQYLAPEQIVGGTVDQRTDIYALGLLLFFIVTGRTPFEVKRVNQTQEIARMQVQTSLPRPTNIRATLPPAIDDIFMQCVQKSPEARYQTIAELLTDLKNLHSSSAV